MYTQPCTKHNCVKKGCELFHSRSNKPAKPNGLECPVCLSDGFEPHSFLCGHIICKSCASTVEHCPVCRASTEGKLIRLFL